MAYDPSSDAVETAVASGAEGAASLAELCSKLPSPKVVWLMVPAGDITEYEGKVRLIAVGFGEVATAVNNAAVVIDPEAHVFPGHSSEGS